MDCTNDRSQHRGAGSSRAAEDATGAYGEERRARGERRRTAGLFELRARREGSGGDRRRQPQSPSVARRRLQALWRRVRP